MRSWLAKLGLTKQAKIKNSYDYVIVGAGSAGCVLANRLSANPANSVLLLEAGGPDKSPLIRMPFGWTTIAYHKNFSWMHRTKASPALDGRSMDWPRGKLLGGSSSTNGMVYVRGQAADYDQWAALGNAGWSWQEVLPYFRKSEDFHAGESAAHGVGGELHVEVCGRDELGDRYISACVEAGMPQSDDFNTGEQQGVGYYQVTVKKGVRQSTSAVFLKPVLQRENLTVVTHAMAEQVLFEGERAVGIQFSHGKKASKRISITVKASREVILSGGVINTPQLLQLSGVGPADLLTQHSIPVIKALPGVGENLQDHLGVMVAREINTPITLAAELKPHRLLYNLYLYWRYKTGIINTPGGYVGVFLKSDPSLESADMQLHFNSVSGYREDSGKSVLDKVNGATSVLTPMRPESRGSVKIVSTDPYQHPAIDANYMATEKDRADMLKTVHIQRRLFAGSAIEEVAGDEIRPGSHLQNDEDLMAYIRASCVTNYHPVGTCKMGNDEMAVVDDKLRIHGLKNIRVVDASIMPTLISGNTNATTIMIAERAAEFILADNC